MQKIADSSRHVPVLTDSLIRQLAKNAQTVAYFPTCDCRRVPAKHRRETRLTNQRPRRPLSTGVSPTSHSGPNALSHINPTRPHPHLRANELEWRKAHAAWPHAAKPSPDPQLLSGPPSATGARRLRCHSWMGWHSNCLSKQVGTRRFAQ